MLNHRTIVRIPFLLLALLCGMLGLLAGCSNSVSGGLHDISTGEPPHAPGQPRAISGVVYTIAESPDLNGTPLTVIDLAQHAVITLTGNGTFTPQVTHSMTGGSYTFTNIPPGDYQVSASVTSGGRTLTSAPIQVHVDDTMPTMMANFLLRPDDIPLATISGTIAAVEGYNPPEAIVSLAVQALSKEELEGFDAKSMVITLSTTIPLVQGDGTFSLQVPAGAEKYFIDVHSITSTRVESEAITNIVPSQQYIIPAPFVLTPNDSTPNYPTLTVSNTCITLPRPTQEAYQQTLAIRRAVASSLGASPAKLTRLSAMAQRSSTMRAGETPVSVVENDLIWGWSDAWNAIRDPRVLGYHVYRAASPSATYQRIGSLHDLYQTYFVDLDQDELRLGRTMYYTIASYSSEGRSPISSIIVAAPLKQMTTAIDAQHVVQWTAVPKARAYVVTVYRESPTFNSIPEEPFPLVLPSTATQYDLRQSNLPAGTYYWTVSAYNTPDPANATAESHATCEPVILP